jgi:hypothetical protein
MSLISCVKNFLTKQIWIKKEIVGCTSACLSDDRGLSMHILLTIIRLPRLKIN